MCVAVGAVGVPPAQAKYQLASSDHFMIYADMAPDELRRMAERLEKFHSAMALMNKAAPPKPSPSNRVTVYFVRNDEGVRKLAGDGSKWVQGFYLPRAVGPIAVVPRNSSFNYDDNVPNGALLVLMHEYAHHFLISNTTAALPRWIGEGAAEFYSTARFNIDGSISIGGAAQHRGYEIFNADDVPVGELFDPALYAKSHGKGYDAYYGKSWLLFHYLYYDVPRRGQLSAYLKAIGRGSEQVAAALEAFGDFKVLDRELKAYRVRKLPGLKIAAEKLAIGNIDLRDLTPGEAAILPAQMRSQVGVDKATAPQVMAEARAVAARYPTDAAVQTELAEAFYDAGDDQGAIAAADAAIKADPRRTRAYVQKGFSLFRIADKGGNRPEAITAAMRPLRALNAIEPDHTQPLVFFYRTFQLRGEKPSDLAIAGLQRAAELAPFDFGLRMTAGMQAIRDRDLELARYFLRPVAFSPHGGSLAEAARKALERAEREPGWDGSELDVPAEDDSGAAG
jgi:tetratricopeptide (TPR) repeat protein